MRFLLITLLLVFVAACGSSPDAATSEPTEAGGTTSTQTGLATEVALATTVAAQPTSVPLATTVPAVPNTIPPMATAAVINPSATIATAQPAPAQQPLPEPSITLNQPVENTTVNGVAPVAGVASITPFEKTLVGEVRDSEGYVMGQLPITTQGEYGAPALFSAQIPFSAPATTRPGKVVVYDTDESDGSLFAIAAVDVTLAGYTAPEPRIILPTANQITSLPLHIEVAGLDSGLNYTARLLYADGTVLEQTASAVAGGWLIMNLDWATESQPPQPVSQDATLQIVDDNGGVLQQKVFVVAHDNDAMVQPIKTYFWLGSELREVTRYVPRTSAIGTAALRELCWGPAGNEAAAAGMQSVLPSPEQIAVYPGREADWSGRVYVRSVRIENGIAYIDWSAEMAAWGGGSAALFQLEEQVRQTMTQFGTVDDIRMTVEGSEEILQP